MPTLNVHKEEAKYNKQLIQARASDAKSAWKSEARALFELGHIARWTGRENLGFELMNEGAQVCRSHTFQKSKNSDY